MTWINVVVRFLKQKDPMVTILDDDEAVRESLRFLLEGIGFVVTTFASGAAFLSDREADETTCLILDIWMPEMDGFQVLDALKRRGAAYPVIGITGHPTAETLRRARNAGIRRMIEKPFTENEIMTALQDVVGRA